ncbi:MAG: hypothetical protein QCI00_09465, partial [Candidatus Thermoplasmatota archaeon]|nr:hypothetical protein [Candidatus Thermoplasmatota archaeon]
MDRKKILSVVVILFSITGLSIATVIHDVSDTEIDYFFPAEDCEQACCVFDDKDQGVASGFSAYQTLDPLPAKTEE